jgi:hypothetical protein
MRSPGTVVRERRWVLLVSHGQRALARPCRQPRPDAGGKAGGSGGGPLSPMRRVGSVAWSGGAAAIGPAGQLPTALMRRPMMRPTQQGQIRQVGGATIRPGDQMMALAPGQGPVTVGEHTAAVADGQGAALGRGDDPAGPADIEGLAGDAAEGWGEQVHGGLEPVGQVPVATGVIPQMVAARVAAGVAGDQHPGHRAVAGQPATRLRAERRGPAGLPPTACWWPSRLSKSTVTVSWGRTPPVWGSCRPPGLAGPVR